MLKEIAKAAGVETARTLIEGGSVSCVLIKDGELIHKADGRGVSPLISLLDESPELLTGALVVDRIIGKAAAMALALGGASGVYGLTMSKKGLEYLKSRGIPAAGGRLIETINNRAGDGICPLEQSVSDIDDPQEGVARLRETMAQLRARAQAAGGA